MPADNIRRLALTMDQSAAPLFTTAHNDQLCLIDIREFFAINRNRFPQLAFFISFVMVDLVKVDRGEEVGDVEMVHEYKAKR